MNVNNYKIIARNIALRKDNVCCNCNSKLLKGEKIIVKTWKEGKTVKRQYFCTACGEEEGVENEN